MNAFADSSTDPSSTSSPAPHSAMSAMEDLYGPLLTPSSLVIAQLGQTLDGRIATQQGHSRYITGSADIEHLHRLRALVDAVVVGAQTVILDDPQLTVRKVAGKNPVRVLLDPAGRIPHDRRILQEPEAPTLWIRNRLQEESAANALALGAHVEVLTWPEPVSREGFPPGQVLDVLAARGLRRVLIEGGGITVSRFLAAGVLDRLHLTVAPMLLGSGRPSITLDVIDRLDDALRPACRHFSLGPDVLFDLDLRSILPSGAG